MKNKNLLLVLFLSAVVGIASSCKKKGVNPNVDQLSQLPPATQTGANTMGALINGKAFVPHDDSFYSHSYQCNYIYLNGGYYLNVYASNTSSYNYTVSVAIGTNAMQINEGQTLKLGSMDVSGNSFGLYNILDDLTSVDYKTTNIVNGQCLITKFDQTKHIISGTFFFNAINLAKGDTVHVTDGRFDMKYTQ